MKNSSSESMAEAENKPVGLVPLLQQVRTTTLLPVVARHQYAITEPIPQTSLFCKHVQLQEFPCDIATVKTCVTRMVGKYWTINPEGVVYRL